MIRDLAREEKLLFTSDSIAAEHHRRLVENTLIGSLLRQPGRFLTSPVAEGDFASPICALAFEIGKSQVVAGELDVRAIVRCLAERIGFEDAKRRVWLWLTAGIDGDQQFQEFVTRMAFGERIQG